jgi:hypothetical protein
MNRAWIPAGALASVSVAGLIALGPLIDSMGTKVPFPVSVAAPSASTTPAQVIPVSFDAGTLGSTDTETAAFNSRGSEAKALPENTDSGFVGLNKRLVVPTKSVTPKATPAKKKKAAPRPKSIGTYGEQNSSEGLAGGTSGSTQYGEQTQTPGG